VTLPLTVPDSVTGFKGKPDFHDGVYKLLNRVKDPEMRKLALSITRDCPARDDRCEDCQHHNPQHRVAYVVGNAGILSGLGLTHLPQWR
jgi:hypothetical protein